MFVYNAAQIGRLEKPLSGLVLHIGEGGPNSQPSEAAWIGSAMVNNAVVPHITVYVSPSSLNTMRSVYYTKVGTHITVEPLLFNESELDAKAFLSLMAIGSSEGAPLYMQTILSILRELGEQYTYQEFMIRLERKKQDLLPAQLTGLKQRMELLESFLEKPAYGRKQQAVPVRFAAGQLTIVDLSDPFIDSASACGFFEILTRLFVRANVNTGKVLVVDEAHKVAMFPIMTTL
ncbi:hypothetical protein PHLCEN_2v12337 [Hermanssonia centrifuga]|uniref:Uncharacterized protein n=1 Tax=Hermanssonia centrifuga TaxID=98765 RepID=A0A2R6NHH0_9APHY|nr:hypothetical protein PHLCEN_2v12337 [Hermanssonia centrifuga]